MLSITRLKILKSGHFKFNMTNEGVTVCGIIYRMESGAILCPIRRNGFPAVRINPKRIPMIRKFIEKAIYALYDRTEINELINNLQATTIRQ